MVVRRIPEVQRHRGDGNSYDDPSGKITRRAFFCIRCSSLFLSSQNEKNNCQSERPRTGSRRGGY